ncbi:unnamed protein product [Gongylonema pulchrum]|uniref:Endo/exonuclease/phosphatase domain-containing protein n=1 Tax=Gongylonema pulchrum TaxID=637853 RepID=A0A183DFR2_9BILA|nr:unnamed protein product [Gongylonema pulchrum]
MSTRRAFRSAAIYSGISSFLVNTAATFFLAFDECGPKSGRECPYVLCGDFNIQPYCAIYNFIVNSVLSFRNLRRHNISGQCRNGGPLVGINLLPAALKIGHDCRFGNLQGKPTARDNATGSNATPALTFFRENVSMPMILPRSKITLSFITQFSISCRCPFDS